MQPRLCLYISCVFSAYCARSGSGMYVFTTPPAIIDSPRPDQNVMLHTHDGNKIQYEFLNAQTGAPEMAGVAYVGNTNVGTPVSSPMMANTSNVSEGAKVNPNNTSGVASANSSKETSKNASKDPSKDPSKDSSKNSDSKNKKSKKDPSTNGTISTIFMVYGTFGTILWFVL